MNENGQKLLTVKEASEYLRLSRAQVYLMISRKELPYTRLSKRRLVIREGDLVNWIERKSVEARFV